MYTKEMIQDNLRNDSRWVERALVVLYHRQTSDEQDSGHTHFLNNRGFTSSDSRYLTYCSKWVIQGRHLNDKHLEKCRGKVLKYWKQIQEEINVKQGVSK